MYEGQIILKGLRLCTGTSLLGKHTAAQQTKPPAAHWPLRKVWFREFPFIKVFPIGRWSFFCCRNCLHSVAVYSLGFPQWPVVIPQVHITRINRNWGPFFDTRSGTACCNFGLWWLLQIFLKFSAVVCCWPRRSSVSLAVLLFVSPASLGWSAAGWYVKMQARF